jgi:hypothetical protein
MQRPVSVFSWGLGAVAALLSVAVWSKRGPWVGVVAVVTFAAMAASASAGDRWALWLRRHRASGIVLGAFWAGLLAFLALLQTTDQPAERCAVQAGIGGCVFAVALMWRLHRLGRLGRAR